MSHYSEQTKRALLFTPIVGILAALGKRTDRPAHRGFYFSPLREESHPSFQINESANVWKDWGTGECGGVLDLVCRIRNCSRAEAVDFLASLRPQDVSVESGTMPVAGRDSSSIVIDSTGPLTSGFLISYARRRGIARETLMSFCEEVAFHVTTTGHSYRSIGFRNNSGGYVLRNAMSGTISKLSTRPAGITTFDSMLTRTEVAFSDRVVVVEGFMDFLSLVTLCMNKGADVCVLNSGANIRRAVPYIGSHRHADLLLDNDPAGNAYTRQIMDLCPSVECSDLRAALGPYNDLNDLLLGHPGVRKPSCHQRTQDITINNVKQNKKHL